MSLDFQILGKGIYTPREAARLIGTNPQDVRRWTRGSGPSQPLWNAYYQNLDDSSEISFLDLIEVRVVSSLRKNGVTLQAIRYAIEYAQDKFNLDRPLASLKFRTDGREILIDAIEGDGELTSLAKGRAGQKVFNRIVQQSLIDLEFQDNRPIRWRPNKSKQVIIDPERSFGSPILDEYGVSTRVLSEEYAIYSDLKCLSAIYDIPPSIVKQAINFERGLDGQSLI